MSRHDFYVNSEAQGTDVSLAWKWACKLLGETDAPALWLVGLDMKKLKYSSDIVAAVGEENAKLFTKGEQLNINGKIVKYYTERTLPRIGENAIVLLIHPTTTLMTKANEMLICAALIVVPYFFKDVQAWINSHKPTDILQSLPS
jgi:hypothetical protein